jgi:hypothetical protein
MFQDQDSEGDFFYAESDPNIVSYCSYGSVLLSRSRICITVPDPDQGLSIPIRSKMYFKL